jgi:hypothetical protein
MSSALLNVPTALYRLYAVGRRLLYVGIAADPESRWRQHATTASWWPEVVDKEVEWHPNRAEAAAAEIKAIDTEHPLHNKSRALAVRPPGAKPTNKTSVYLPDELAARVKESGLPMGELVRRGLEAGDPEGTEAIVRRVLREELAAALAAQPSR